MTETVEAAGQRARRRAHRRGGAPGKAEAGTWRGLLWTLVVAADFVLMSNPLVLLADMDRALTLAVLLTGATLVLTLPWVRAPRVPVPVLLFLAWLLLSSAWSIQPSFTSEAWAQTTAVAAVAVVIYTHVGARVLAYGFLLGGAGVSAASIYAFHADLPGASIAPLDAWVMAGIGSNPNILAYTLTLSLCGAFAAVPRRAWARVAWLVAVGLNGYGLINVDSATGDLTTLALAASAVVLAAYGPLRRTVLRTRESRLMAVAATALGAVATLVLITQVLGQDLLTFSDRTPLWSASIAVAQERPFTGFGYGAVWQHPWKPPLLNIVIGDIWDRSGVPLSHGHNSAVDLVVEVGLVGVLLMALVMVTAALRAVRLMRASHGADPLMARFIVLCLVDLVLFGVTEPMAAIPLGWWALVLLTEPPTRGGARIAVAREGGYEAPESR